MIYYTRNSNRSMELIIWPTERGIWWCQGFDDDGRYRTDWRFGTTDPDLSEAEAVKWWEKLNWTISNPWSMIPFGPCAECDGPAIYDYLCKDCRHGS